MRMTAEMGNALLAQITAEPEREVIMPEWAYPKRGNQPQVYVNSMPTPLIRALHDILIRPLGEDEGIDNPPGVDPHNVNPHLAVVLRSRQAKAACRNNHAYTDEDWVEGVGYRCQTCRSDRLKGTPSATDINRAKTHCSKNHVLVKRKNGRRRCLECPREQTRRWRENRES
jgi:hypothetical protein